MSQEENAIIILYYSAIECYEEVEAFFDREDVDIRKIKNGLRNCYHKIERIILAEDTNCPFLVHLFQLQHHMLELLKFVETQKPILFKNLSIEPASTSVPSKSTDNEKEKLLNVVEGTIEVPRIKGLDEVAGLWEIKKLLKSLVILPKTQPQLFTNQKVFNSLLLFGPPGTGKTQLVHALAYEADANLFCVTAGNIMSSFVGQTEKNIKFLFDYIKTKDKFSLLFIDEVDCFCRRRSDSEQEHTRRIKTELLCQISQIESQSSFFLICATNCPWDLDAAFLRRFQKRLYIPLPDYAERRDLFRTFTKDTPLEETFAFWEYLIVRTEGWSGSDISDLVQQALNIPLLELQDAKIWKNSSDGLYEPINEADDFNLEDIYCKELQDFPPGSVKARQVQLKDLFNAFDHVNLTVSNSEIQKYEEFCKK